MPPAPIPGNVGGGSAIGGLLAGGAPGAGADDLRAKLEQLASQVSEIGTMVSAIAQDYPMAADEVSRVNTLLKQIVIKVAKAAPVTTASGQGVPTGASQAPAPISG